MVPVKNTKLQAIPERGDVMSRDKSDVMDVKFTLNGKACGVHAVAIC